ncbi:MAG: type II toxin-antitoxin system death-on-curing family toxin [Alphaproteobacteria bacterium]|nr:type II toxin-antitoxin system death-on-curing family toxin [Alphaproteobacteria bacterium]
MKAWAWLNAGVVRAIHEEQIAEHGGQPGIRDMGLLGSALNRPVNKAHHGETAIAALAAAYAYGIARNHPFLDGNKRVALVCLELFLALNGHELRADDASCLDTMTALADGTLTEPALAAWVEENLWVG